MTEDFSKMDAVAEGELRELLFIAEHNIAFLAIDHLTKLLPAICKDSKLEEEENSKKKREMERKRKAEAAVSAGLLQSEELKRQRRELEDIERERSEAMDKIAAAQTQMKTLNEQMKQAQDALQSADRKKEHHQQKEKSTTKVLVKKLIAKAVRKDK